RASRRTACRRRSGRSRRLPPSPGPDRLGGEGGAVGGEPVEPAPGAAAVRRVLPLALDPPELLEPGEDGVDGAGRPPGRLREPEAPHGRAAAEQLREHVEGRLGHAGESLHAINASYLK